MKASLILVILLVSGCVSYKQETPVFGVRSIVDEQGRWTQVAVVEMEKSRATTFFVFGEAGKLGSKVNRSGDGSYERAINVDEFRWGADTNTAVIINSAVNAAATATATALRQALTPSP